MLHDPETSTPGWMGRAQGHRGIQLDRGGSGSGSGGFAGFIVILLIVLGIGYSHKKSEEEKNRSRARATENQPHTTWEGMVDQPGSSLSPYPIRMTVNDELSKGETAGTTDYPTVRCGGSLIFVELYDDGTYLFREKMKHGHGRCVNNGQIYVTFHPEYQKMTWSWFYSDGRYSAGATLTRVE